MTEAMSESSPLHFREQAAAALNDAPLQRALGNVRAGFIAKRAKAVAKLPEFDDLRDAAVEIKNHTLAHLDLYLAAFERRCTEAGGEVHWARDEAESRAIVLDICRRAGAKTVAKGKSMIGEEMHLNPFLEEHGIEPVETDLGEYIIQLRHEPPSHIIAPALHLNKEQIADAFREYHTDQPADRDLSDRAALLAEARQELRDRFVAADVGVTGANFLIAETGSSVIVTNEGNGDLSQTLPRVHIVLASLEKVVPTLEDATTIMRVLARSATGQEMSVYTTVSTGPRRAGDLDGPAEYHVVLLDNGRSKLLGTEFQDVLRCIRCGACLNHCPVYGAVGGHAYGTIYPGPIGKVLSPALYGLENTAPLPNASSFCGRCEEVCPMRIPLPTMMRHWREREFETGLIKARARWALRAWGFAARRPALYRLGTRLGAGLLAWRGRRRGRFRRLPFAAGWTVNRDLPAPQPGGTFQSRWRGPRTPAP
jgi:L-lactate dehydrogenase complex protein LldF